MNERIFSFCIIILIDASKRYLQEVLHFLLLRFDSKFFYSLHLFILNQN